jgi:hypothetical protein
MPSRKEPEISRHALYEKIERRYEEDVVRRLLQALEEVGPPPGWYQGGSRGPKERFDWRSMTVLLSLMFYWDFTFREMATHIQHSTWLLEALGLNRAPAKSTLQKACGRIPDTWLKEVNRAVLQGKKTRPAPSRPGGRLDRPAQRQIEPVVHIATTQEGQEERIRQIAHGMLRSNAERKGGPPGL